jgi:hypothetical protein
MNYEEELDKAFHTINIKLFKIILKNKNSKPESVGNYYILNAVHNEQNDFIEALWNDEIVKNTLKNDNLSIYNSLITKDIKNKVQDF